MSKKSWFEPNGIFEIKVPVEWENVDPKNDGKSPFSFQLYDNPVGCFQISCYPLTEIEINPAFLHQNNESKIEWLEIIKDDPEYAMPHWYAKIADHLIFAKCIYLKSDKDLPEVHLLLEHVKETLDSFVYISTEEREYTKSLKLYYGFIGSLAASYDLRDKAIKNKSFVELIAISANQIDAFLRMAIMLKTQLLNSTKEMETKYLFQMDNDRSNIITERAIYKKAKELGIVDEDTFNELNQLYDLRNMVIHAYIITNLKTIDIVEISIKYFHLSEKINLVLKSIEEEQIRSEVGLYGTGFEIEYEPTDLERKIAYSMANDKHLLDEFHRKLN